MDTELSFLTKRPVRGQTLAKRLARGPMSAPEALTLAVEIGAVLHQAHSADLFYGAIHPNAVMLTQDGVQLLDPLPGTRGTTPYTSPEQLEGAPADARSDVFSFGALLYEMIAGWPPFHGETDAQLRKAILEREPASLLAALAGRIPPQHAAQYAALDSLLAGCLKKEPEQRRQRIQNAIIELKLILRPLARAGAPARRRQDAGPVAGGNGAANRAPASRLPQEPAELGRSTRPAPMVDPYPEPAEAEDRPWMSGPVPPRTGFAGWPPEMGLADDEDIERVMDYVRANPLPEMELAFDDALPPPALLTEPVVEPPLPYMVARQEAAALGRQFWWLVAALVLFVAMAGGVAAWLMKKPRPEVLRFALVPPANTTYPGTPAVSPDGRYVVLSAVGQDGKRVLWLSSFDAQQPTKIEGTENGFSPFWAPDSRTIAFFAGQALKRIPALGGPAEEIAKASDTAGGGSWSRDGWILFAPDQEGPLYRVMSTGGKATPVTELHPMAKERAHVWPQLLPDGKHFLFYDLADSDETTGVYWGSVAGKETRKLLSADGNAIFSPGERSGGGFLIFVRDRILFCQHFNMQSGELQGDPEMVAENMSTAASIGLAPISVSNNGVLLYQALGVPSRQLLWLDRAGAQLARVNETGEWGPPRIAPDGRRAVAGKKSPTSDAADLWLLSLDGSAAQLTDSPQHEASPVWSPDGGRIAMLSDALGNFDLFATTLAGGKPELLFRNEERKYPTDWSPDGRYLLYGALGANTRSDLWALRLADHKALPLLRTVYGEGNGVFAPNGKWIAYQSDASDRLEVYAMRFEPDGGNAAQPVQVSVDGGGLPRWRRDGKELFFTNASGRVMAVDVTWDGGEFRSGPPHALFRMRPVPKAWNLFDASPDGQRFLVNAPLEWPSAAPITVETNWTEKLRK
jgi:Tol biopolymer transport system component